MQVLPAVPANDVHKLLKAVPRPLATMRKYLENTAVAHYLPGAHLSRGADGTSADLTACAPENITWLLGHAASCTSLKSLSFAGLPLVHNWARRRDDNLLGRTLRALPQLSRLDLRDTALRYAVHALTAALPHMPQLQVCRPLHRLPR